MAAKEKPQAPTPMSARRGPYIHRLDRVRGVRQELARIYKEARLGRLKPADATKLCFVLTSVGRMIETSSLEERIAQLEQRLEAEEQRRLEEQL